MKTTKLLSIIPTLLLALICLCAAAKNTGEPLLAELLLKRTPAAERILAESECGVRRAAEALVRELTEPKRKKQRFFRLQIRFRMI